MIVSSENILPVEGGNKSEEKMEYKFYCLSDKFYCLSMKNPALLFSLFTLKEHNKEVE